MAYVETSDDWFKGGIHFARVQYAAFLYDEYKKFPAYTPAKALAAACRQASISSESLRQHLPAHNARKRKLRNLKIIDMRASGFSVNLIAEMLGIHRATVARVLDAHKSRVNAADRYSSYKIRGRLKFGDPRLNETEILL